jgi:hypothetical protein
MDGEQALKSCNPPNLQYPADMSRHGREIALDQGVQVRVLAPQPQKKPRTAGFFVLKGMRAALLDDPR